MGTPKHSVKKTSADESRSAIEGLVMKKSSGANISRLKNDPAVSTSSKQQGQPPKLPVVPNPESPGR